MKFRQFYNYGLGNTIMCTPAMQYYYQMTGVKVKVYFENDDVRLLLDKAPFIEVVDSMTSHDFHSGMTNQSIPDSEYLMELVRKKYGFPNIETPHTWVNNPNLPEKKYVLFARGCANPNKRGTKDPGEKIYIDLIDFLHEQDIEVKMVGSVEDMDWNMGILRRTGIEFTTGISNALNMISECMVWVSNDTGLYHVAGAMKKRGFIMWCDTNFVKNQSPNKNFVYSFEDYMNDFMSNFFGELILSKYKP